MAENHFQYSAEREKLKKQAEEIRTIYDQKLVEMKEWMMNMVESYLIQQGVEKQQKAEVMTGLPLILNQIPISEYKHN